MRYLHYDVFTDRPFEGNQLAVFPEPPQGITPELMQTITREMNFSECTFLFPAEGSGDIRMRIFTPGEELPMAGHPTVGTTFALAHEGIIARGRERFVFELGVGPTPVALEWSGADLSFAWMTQQRPVFGASVTDRGAFAAALGLGESDLLPHPVQVVSCGVPFLFAGLATRRAVDRVAIDYRSYVRALTAARLPDLPLFIFTPERGGDEATVYSRMLAPAFGIGEDPATGGASGPLGCYLLHHGLVDAAAARSILSLQGVAMKRPSRIHIDIESSGSEITGVRIGGKAVRVGQGELTVGIVERQ